MKAEGVLRRLVPRAVRNQLRDPRRTAVQLYNYLTYHFGYRPHFEVRSDWAFKCHPVCLRVFRPFRNDPAQKQELDGFIARCCRSMRFFDIGAHYGFFTLAALHFGGAEARAVVAEPSGKALGVLRANLKINRIARRVTIVHAAVGEKDGKLPMLTTGPQSADYFVAPCTERSDVTYVPVKCLDTIVEESGLDPTHIKIDVEGFEEEVIRGGQSVLSRLRPILFLELHGRIIRARGRNPETVLDSLEAIGYQHFEADGRPIERNGMRSREYNCRLICTT